MPILVSTKSTTIKGYNFVKKKPKPKNNHNNNLKHTTNPNHKADRKRYSVEIFQKFNKFELKLSNNLHFLFPWTSCFLLLFFFPLQLNCACWTQWRNTWIPDEILYNLIHYKFFCWLRFQSNYNNVKQYHAAAVLGVFSIKDMSEARQSINHKA